MSRFTRQVIVFGAPIFVGILNLFHPVHFENTNTYDSLHGVVKWWIALHLMNIAGFALLALAGFLLVQRRLGKAATIARIALAIFVPTYIAFDAITGIGTGILIQYAGRLPMNELVAVKPVIDAYWSGNVATLLAIIGSVAWNLGMSMSAMAFTEPKRRLAMIAPVFLAGAVDSWGYSAATFGTLPWWIAALLIGLLSFLISRASLPVSLLTLSGILFGITHVVPFGPLGMACFVVAAALLEWAPRKAQVTQPINPMSPSHS
ncbi:MAG TPA: hypothetical protein VLD65_05340 [Anaerolineales bacterium]|nr:hypothetical protein [Anaerolineales bacterium]